MGALVHSSTISSRAPGGAITVGVLLMALVATMAAWLPASQARAAEPPRVVDEEPVAWTPQILDGRVLSIAQMGDKIVLAGRFTRVRESTTGGAPELSRSNMVAFDSSTGKIDPDFAPTFDGDVETVIPAGNGEMFVGGSFSTVNGSSVGRVAKLRLADGGFVSGFSVPTINGRVSDLRLVQRAGLADELVISGFFTHIGGNARRALASLNPSSGALTPFVDFTFATTRTGTTGVAELALSPDGTDLLAIGNFTSVNDEPRPQIARWDTSGSTAVLSSWQTDFYSARCSASFDSYMRDVDISPDGSYFVVSTTGAYGGSNSPCDSAARFELSDDGPGIVPTWRTYSGGDTLWGIEITDHVIYLGGHQRWMNNPFAGDRPGDGAVPRPGIAALDPINGIPFSWNPGKERGVAVFDMLNTDQGLWVGSDTDYFGTNIGWRYRPRIAFLPVGSGTPIPPNETGALANDTYLLGRLSGSSDPSVLYRVNAGGPSIPSVDDGPDWQAGNSTPYANTGNNASWSTLPTLDSSVPNSDDDRAPGSLFLSEKWDPGTAPEMLWSFPVAAGTNVAVRVYLANQCSCTDGPGDRVFNVSLDGTPWLSNLDLTATYGHQVGHMESFITTSDGSVDIEFGHVIENPLVSGIEIIDLDAEPDDTSVVVDDVRRQFYAGTGSPEQQFTLTGPETWAQARGGVLIDGTLYTGWADGSFRSWSFDGETFGAPETIDLYNGRFAGDLASVTGLFFDEGRLYFTKANDTSLYYRKFTPESTIVGADRFQASGDLPALAANRVAGMFLSGETLYFSDKDSGHLYRIGFTDGVLSGPAVLADNTMDWRSRAAIVWQGEPAPRPNVAPSAVADVSCEGWECTFDGSGSSDSDGSVVGFAWEFGDGASGTGETASRTFSAEGDYTATLVVTDDRGDTDSTTVDFTVVAPPNVDPTAVIAADCAGLVCEFDGSGSTDEGVIESYEWDFGDGSPGASGEVVSHEFAAADTYEVSLTVTDDRGGSNTATESVTVDDIVSAIGFRGASEAQSNWNQVSVQVPASVQPGDAMVLFVTGNRSDVVMSDPSEPGWTPLEDVVDQSMQTRAWWKIAEPGDAGATISVSATTKLNGQLLAYSGTDAADPVADVAAVAEDGSGAEHTTPEIATAPSGAWVVSYWADKTSATESWAVPAGTVERQQVIGAGGGRVTSLTADSGGPVDGGPVGGLTATASSSNPKATMYTVILRTEGPTAPNVAPSAVADVSCEGWECTFDGSGSSDSDGSVVGFAWEFGDGASGTGETASRTFSAEGDYTATLVVTDDRGDTDSTTVDFTVVAPPNVDPTAVIAADCAGLVCEFDGSGSTDEGVIESYEWDFGDGSPGASGEVVSHEFAAADTYEVSLTVTDDRGGSNTATESVTVDDIVSAIGFRGASEAQSNWNQVSVQVPASVQPGDAMVLFVTGNRSDVVMSDPSEPGWTPLEDVVDQSMQTRAWWKIAEPGDAGATISVSATTKLNGQLLAYSGTDAADPVADVAAVAEDGSGAEHTTPEIATAPSGAWVVSYWADKTSATESWAVPAGTVERQQVIGAGGGRVTSLTADSGGPVDGGPVGGLTATASSSNPKATMYTVILRTG